MYLAAKRVVEDETVGDVDTIPAETQLGHLVTFVGLEERPEHGLVEIVRVLGRIELEDREESTMFDIEYVLDLAEQFLVVLAREHPLYHLNYFSSQSLVESNPFGLNNSSIDITKYVGKSTRFLY